MAAAAIITIAAAAIVTMAEAATKEYYKKQLKLKQQQL